MNAEAWIGAAAVVLNILLLAGGYGAMREAVNALRTRVEALEAEMSAVTDLKADMARIDERTAGMKTGIDAILNSWILQAPPGYAPPGVTPPRGRTSR